MWNSPIEYIESEIEAKLEDAVFEAVQRLGIHVDRDELLRALAYDRGQYELGYEEGLKAAEAKIVRCKDCLYYDCPHVENDGKRYEYAEMPKEAFDVLGTNLVTSKYGINVGGRCCVDYKGYIDDKRVFRHTDDYCSRGERKDE